MIVLYYVLVGPFVGTVFFWLLFTALASLGEVRVFSVIELLIGYVLGMIPALAAGVAHMLARRDSVRGTAAIVRVTLTGAVAQLVMTVPMLSAKGALPVAATWIAIAAVVAFVLSAAAEARSRAR